VSYKRFGLLLPLSLGYVLDASAAGWEEKFYNPMPDAADVVLPMPCEGSMVFTGFIPVTGPLDDYPINIGQDGAEPAMSNGPGQHSSPAVSRGHSKSATT
jgi:hypothetical protein